MAKFSISELSIKIGGDAGGLRGAINDSLAALDAMGAEVSSLQAKLRRTDADGNLLKVNSADLRRIETFASELDLSAANAEKLTQRLNSLRAIGLENLTVGDIAGLKSVANQLVNIEQAARAAKIAADEVKARKVAREQESKSRRKQSVAQDIDKIRELGRSMGLTAQQATELANRLGALKVKGFAKVSDSDLNGVREYVAQIKEQQSAEAKADAERQRNASRIRDTMFKRAQAVGREIAQTRELASTIGLTAQQATELANRLGGLRNKGLARVTDGDLNGVREYVAAIKEQQAAESKADAERHRNASRIRDTMFKRAQAVGREITQMRELAGSMKLTAQQATELGNRFGALRSKGLAKVTDRELMDVRDVLKGIGAELEENEREAKAFARSLDVIEKELKGTLRETGSNAFVGQIRELRAQLAAARQAGGKASGGTFSDRDVERIREQAAATRRAITEQAGFNRQLDDMKLKVPFWNLSRLGALRLNLEINKLRKSPIVDRSQILRLQAMASAMQTAAVQGNALSRAMQRIGRNLQFFILFVGGAKAVDGFRRALSNVIRLGSEAEDFSVTLRALTKDVEATNKVTKELFEFAKTTPFQIQELREATITLKAYRFANESLVPTLRVLGEVGARVGRSVKEIAEIYGIARVEQRQYTKDLRQFASRGIPIWDLLAAQMQVSTDRIKELATDGAIAFENVEAALVSFANETDTLGERSKTLSGRWSNFMDVLSETGGRVGKSSFTGLSSAIDQLQLSIETIEPETLERLGTSIGNIAAELGLLNAQSAANNLASFLDTIAGTIRGTRAAWNLFKTGITGVHVALSSLDYLFGTIRTETFQENVDSARDSVEAFHRSMKSFKTEGLSDQIDAAEASISKYADKVREIGNATDEQIDAFVKAATAARAYTNTLDGGVGLTPEGIAKAKERLGELTAAVRDAFREATQPKTKPLEVLSDEALRAKSKILELVAAFEKIDKASAKSSASIAQNLETAMESFQRKAAELINANLLGNLSDELLNRGVKKLAEDYQSATNDIGKTIRESAKNFADQVKGELETPADALREQIRKITEANRLLNEDGKKILSDEAAAKARDAAIKKYRKEIEKTTEKAKELKREIGINEGFEAFSKEALNLNKRIVTKQDLPKKDRPAIDAKAVGAAIQQAIADGEKEAADAMLKAQQQNGETQKQIAELTEKLRNEMSTRLGEIRDLIRDGGELPEDFMPRMNEIEKRLGIPQGNPQANANPGGFLHVPNVIDAIRKGEDQTEKQGNKQNQLSANTNRLLEEMNRRIADIELNIQVEEVQG